MNAAVQLYSLRALDRPLPDLVALVGETPLSGVEFAGLGDADPSAVAAALERAGLTAPSAHVPIDDLEAAPGSTVEPYRRLGCETLVVPFLAASHFERSSAVDRTVERLSGIASRLEEAGLGLAYHNHDQEFTPIQGGDAFDRLATTLEGVGIELDVGWATAAGRDPVALLERYGDRIDLLHVKDVDDGRPCALGAGDVPLAACVDAAREADVEWAIYEHDEPDEPAVALRRDADVLAELLA